jgi:hypothetical protein
MPLVHNFVGPNRFICNGLAELKYSQYSIGVKGQIRGEIIYLKNRARTELNTSKFYVNERKDKRK